MNTIKIKNHLIEIKTQPLQEKNGKYFFCSEEKLLILESGGNLLINKFKNFLQNKDLLYKFLRYFFYPVLINSGKNVGDFLKIGDYNENEIIINLGSGNNTQDSFINIDLLPLNKVDIIADAENLPFIDNSIDRIIMETCLEHIKNPDKVIEESYRVLKSGGLLFVTVPFIMGYHDSPSDYHRWTKEGLKILLKKFNLLEIGNKGGVVSALGWVLSEFIATLLSFGFKPLHFIIFHLSLIIFIPLKLLDFIFVHYPTTSNISSMFYAMARKK